MRYTEHYQLPIYEPKDVPGWIDSVSAPGFGSIMEKIDETLWTIQQASDPQDWKQIADDVENLKGAVTAISGKIGQLETASNVNANNIRDVRTNVETLEERVNTQGLDIEDNSNSIKQLQQEQLFLRNDLDRTKETVNTSTENISNLQTTVDTNTGDIETLKEEQTTLTNDLNGTKEDVTTVTQTAEKNKSDIADILLRLQAMEEKWDSINPTESLTAKAYSALMYDTASGFVKVVNE